MKKLLDVALLVFVSVLLLSMSAFAQPNDVGTISGTVTVQDLGDPIMGAVVKAYHVDGHPWPAATAWSDSEGNYELTVPYDDYHVKAEKWGFFPEWWEEAACREDATPVTVSEESNPEGIDFTLTEFSTEEGSISGTVTDAGTSEPIEGATIFLHMQDNHHFHRMTQSLEDGSYLIDNLPPGTYTLDCFKEGYLPAEYPEPVEVNGNDVTGIDFALEALVFGSISGTVTDASTSEPISEARVHLRLQNDFHFHRLVFTEEDGSYYFDELPPGDYRLECEKYGYFSMEYPELVNVDGNDVTGVDFALEPIVIGGIAGTVTDATTDEPIHWAFVIAINTEYPYFHRWAITDDNGQYLMEVPSGTYNIEAYALDYLPGSLEEPVVVEDTVVTGVDIALMPIVYGSISGTVYDSATGETIAHARIKARMIDSWYGWYGWSDSVGDYTVERLRPGDYRLTAFAYGYFPKVYPDTVTVVGDENVPGIDFYLVSSEGPFDGYISGTVTDEETSEPVADAFLAAFGSSSWHHCHVRFTHSGDDGSYIFENLPPLEYKIFCMAYGYLWEFYDDKDNWWDADIVIPDAENIDFALAASEPGLRAMGGQVYENGMSVPGALVFAKEDGEVKYVTVTHPDGSYIFEGIDAGSYSVEALGPSFNEGSLEEVVVLFSDVFGADIILETTIVDDGDISLPTSTTLMQNFPNPFNSSTTIGFNLASDTEVELSIYDLLGRKVTTLVSDKLTAGMQTITWNGKDAAGNTVATGLYLYVLKTDEGLQSKQMLLLK